MRVQLRQISRAIDLYIEVRQIATYIMQRLQYLLASLLAAFSLQASAQTSAWVTFTAANSPLPDSVVTALATDGDHSVWIGTASGGLAHFDGQWTIYNTTNSHIASDEITCLLSVEHTLWIGTKTAGISILNKVTGRFSTLSSAGSPLPSNHINDIVELPSGRWISTENGGAVLWNGIQPAQYNTSNGLPSNNVACTYFDGQAHWFGTAAGLARLDGSTVTVFNTANSELPGDTVLSIAQDASGRLLIGTHGKGLAALENNTWTTYNVENSGLPDNTVYTITSDLAGDNWLGTSGACGGGAAQYTGNSWAAYDIYQSPIAGMWVYAVLVDAQNNKWFGTEKGLSIYNEAGVLLTAAQSPAAPNTVEMWPNPSTGQVTLQSAATGSTVRIYNAAGAAVRVERLSTAKQTLNLDALPSGLYWVEVQFTESAQKARKPLLLTR